MFEFIYGTNPIMHVLGVFVDPAYTGIGFYDRYDSFYKSYFDEVAFNKKYPGVLPKFM